MAKTKSIVRFSGNPGDINFFEKNGKTFARLSSNLTKDRILKDPAFKRTRENMNEFGGSSTSISYQQECTLWWFG